MTLLEQLRQRRDTARQAAEQILTRAADEQRDLTPDELAEHRQQVDESRVEMMRGYAETTGCRRQFLLGYFGEQLDEPCGNCDTCSDGTAQQHQPNVTEDQPFPVDSAVEHAGWGPGIVMRHEEDRVVVLFETVGYKTLALRAVLEHDLLRQSAGS